MPRGKMAAMVAHAAMTFLAKRISETPDWEDIDGTKFGEIGITKEQHQWLTELDPGLEDIGQVSFAKIVLSVPNEEELIALYDAAKECGLEAHKVVDSGYSHNPANTLCCIAIGPDTAERIRALSGHLPIYR